MWVRTNMAGIFFFLRFISQSSWLHNAHFFFRKFIDEKIKFWFKFDWNEITWAADLEAERAKTLAKRKERCDIFFHVTYSLNTLCTKDGRRTE